MILTPDKIKEYILKPKNGENIKQWREEHNTLDIYYNGGDIAKELNKVKNYENQDQLELRQKIARSTKDLMSYLLSPLNKIFSASGFNESYQIDVEENENKLKRHLNRLPEGVSLRSWMKIYWLQAYIIDPNGVILVETEDGKPYPTYKSIDVVHDYQTHWDEFKYLILEHKKVEIRIDGKVQKKTIYRVYDDMTDALYYVHNDTLYPFTEEKQRECGIEEENIEQQEVAHNFGRVPAYLPSDIIDIKSGGKRSFVFDVDETLKEYLRDSSVHSIYKFLHGFPIFWAYASKCVRCKGTTQVKNPAAEVDPEAEKYIKCPTCNGSGLQNTRDVSNGVRLSIPSGDDPKIAPDIAGYVTPDLQTWSQQVDEMVQMKREMFYAIWGTYLVEDTGREKTATEAFINSQPIMDKLHPIADLVQKLETSIATDIAVMMFSNENYKVEIKYGRRWLIETPDVLWERYITAKKDQAPISTLDYLYNQFLLSEYHNDQPMLDRKIKEFSIEPFVHYSLSDLRGMASQEQIQRKLLFNEWAVSLDIDYFNNTDLETLRSEFDIFVGENISINQTDEGQNQEE